MLGHIVLYRRASLLTKNEKAEITEESKWLYAVTLNFIWGDKGAKSY